MKGYAHLYVIGFAIQPNARELVDDAGVIGIPATYVQATPDLVMGDLLKTMRSSQIFSVCGLPEVDRVRPSEATADGTRSSCSGSTCSTRSRWRSSIAAGDDVPAWFLDTDYNELCFHVSPGVLPPHSAWDNLKKALKGEYDDSRLGPPGRDDERAVRAGRAQADRGQGDRRPGQRAAGGQELWTEAVMTEHLAFEVAEPILNSPFEEPAEHWHIVEGEPPERRPGRRPAVYFYRDPQGHGRRRGRHRPRRMPVELELVNLIRERLDQVARPRAIPGVTRTTLELLEWWTRDGRDSRLFFAQLEAAETIIFLTEARADFLQGIDVPRDEPSDAEKAEGYAGFLRYACKMATGSGKTTVMGMLAAWSILNKVNDRRDARFSDVVLVVCPNVTIRDRLRELDPSGARRASTGPATWSAAPDDRC